ncbi:hypothetical protein AVEN_184887-1 [Araneus ventricosus]|uniref:Secreted protein n=1 Tax=Araneus ventricosus TaxID=182803 RepID=A0A4Y2GD87_ARAVE|nr:hypothetical protein AVEN_184887-1 [Araneus ventricosus]
MLAVSTVIWAFESVMAAGRGDTTSITCNNIGRLVSQLVEIDNCYLGHNDTKIAFRVIPFLGVCRRSHVHASMSKIITNLKAHITEAIARLDRDILQKVWQKLCISDFMHIV